MPAKKKLGIKEPEPKKGKSKRKTVSPIYTETRHVEHDKTGFDNLYNKQSDDTHSDITEQTVQT